MESNYSGPEAWELYKMQEELAELRGEVDELKSIIRGLLDAQADLYLRGEVS